MAKWLIETENLTKTYLMGGQPLIALNGVSVRIAHGEFVAVMGPSGSGKSTFMNLLGCLDNPASGRYLLAGRDVSRLDRDRLAEIRNQNIGFVFQHFNLLPRMTALDNVALPLVYAGLSSTMQRTKALDRLRDVGLVDRAFHLPNQLSGGQQQRIAIARALVNDPLLILADEPTGALDTRTSFEIMDLFQRFNDRGMTVIVVTHETDIATFARRIIGFRDGCLVDDHPVAARRRASELRLQQAG
jgi:putative ABC transport system ATP-binding protein